MTPASLDELLKEWEAEAKGWGDAVRDARRVLSLIAVVRKQREALKDCALADQGMNGFGDDYERGLYDGCHSEAKKARDALVEAERILNADR